MPAANMYKLKYNVELEFVAQCYANQCKFEHDVCRGIRYHENIDQNLGMLIKVKNPEHPDNLKFMVKK